MSSLVHASPHYGYDSSRHRYFSPLDLQSPLSFYCNSLPNLPTMSRNRFTTLLSTVRTWAHIKTRTTQSEARCTTDPPGELHHATHLSTPSRHTSPPIDTPTGPLTPTSHRTLTPIDTITEVPTPTGRPIDASSSDQVQVAQPTSIHDSVGISILFTRYFHDKQYHSGFQKQLDIVTV